MSISKWLKVLKYVSLSIGLLCIITLLFILSILYYQGGEDFPASERFIEKSFLAEKIIEGTLFEYGIPLKNLINKERLTLNKDGIKWDLIEANLLWNEDWDGDGLRRDLTFGLKQSSLDVSFSSGELKRIQVSYSGYPLYSLKIIPSPHEDLAPPLTREKPGEAEMPRVAIVVDDLGYNLEKAKRLMRINAPLTFSVLPQCQFSRDIALLASDLGKDVILHLPMEPKEYKKRDPGPGVLTLDMDLDEILITLYKDLESVPNAIGVNNHMGSAFCEDELKMGVVLIELKRMGYFFMDSLTSPKSVGYSLARRLGLKSGVRNVFLDTSKGEGEVRKRLRQLKSISKNKGKAVGICHPYDPTIKVLEESLDDFIEEGFRIVPLSELME